MSVDIIRQGNSYRFLTTLNLDGNAYQNLATATAVKCAMVEVATGLNVLEVVTPDANILLDEGGTGIVSWKLTPAQSQALNTGLHSLAIQAEEANDTYEWVEQKIVNVKPGYITA